MPNARLTMKLTLDAIGAQFSPVLARKDGRVVHIKRVYRQVDEPLLLFEAHLEEPLFHQNVMIKLAQQKDDAFVLQLSQIGHPRATHAVHDAIAALVGWLREIDPSAEVIDAAYREP